MLNLLGIRPNRWLVALASVAVLVTGLALHRGIDLTVLGAALVAYSAVMLVAGRRGRAE